MPRFPCISLVMLLLELSSASCFAVDSSDSELSKLAANKQWLHLLHYHQAGLFSRYQSQVDDPGFFLAVDGASNPLAELKATLKAFSDQSDATGTEPIRCRFPARYHWLVSVMGTNYFDETHCAEFDQWFGQIDGKGLTLVFPAAYLNSPSSMFGHTLIRVDRHSGNNPLLDYSVNYAANADPDDNELVFSYKGLTGGYPGIFTLLPYHQKVKEYNFLESRDVWEYQLDLTQDEVDQFIRHVWEIRNTHFDYYFFSENCSYQLLTLLDAASPRFNFADQFYTGIIPADTVRIVEQGNAVKRADFRPSTLTRLSNMLAQLDSSKITLAKNLVLSEDLALNHLEPYSTTEQAQILELAYHYSRYLAVRKKQSSELLSKRALALLSARSKSPVQAVFKSDPVPQYRDDQGHQSGRVETRYGHDGNNDYLQLGLRMAYHDPLDPAPGYLHGAQLEMFHAQFRHTFGDRDKTQIQEIRFIDIASYTPRNPLLTPTSWRVSTGFKHPESEPNALMAYLEAGGGLSYTMASQQFYALVEGELNADNDLEQGYRVALGPRLGWLTQHERWSAQLEFHHLYDLAGANFKEQAVEFGVSHRLNDDWQVRIETGYQQYQLAINGKTQYQQTSSIAMMFYF